MSILLKTIFCWEKSLPYSLDPDLWQKQLRVFLFFGMTLIWGLKYFPFRKIELSIILKAL